MRGVSSDRTPPLRTRNSPARSIGEAKRRLPGRRWRDAAPRFEAASGPLRRPRFPSAFSIGGRFEAGAPRVESAPLLVTGSGGAAVRPSREEPASGCGDGFSSLFRSLQNALGVPMPTLIASGLRSGCARCTGPAPPRKRGARARRPDRRILSLQEGPIRGLRVSFGIDCAPSHRLAPSARPSCVPRTARKPPQRTCLGAGEGGCEARRSRASTAPAGCAGLRRRSERCAGYGPSARSSTRRILPETVFGREARNSISRGYL